MEKKKKILIIEDEDAIRTALADVLKKDGFEVLSAPDGLAGRDTALKEHPDLIVLDVIMPKLHGIEVYSTIRGDDWGSNVKIIFLTNVGTDIKVQEAAEHPQTQLVVKNLSNLDDFVVLVKKTLS